MSIRPLDVEELEPLEAIALPPALSKDAPPAKIISPGVAEDEPPTMLISPALPAIESPVTTETEPLGPLPLSPV
jgi:hypothetical protein